MFHILLISSTKKKRKKYFFYHFFLNLLFIAAFFLFFVCCPVTFIRMKRKSAQPLNQQLIDSFFAPRKAAKQELASSAIQAVFEHVHRNANIKPSYDIDFIVFVIYLFIIFIFIKVCFHFLQLHRGRENQMSFLYLLIYFIGFLKYDYMYLFCLFYCSNQNTYKKANLSFH